MSPRNVQKDLQLRKERTLHILDAALQTIAKRGIDSTNIKDIAREANLSVGNIYNYFSSKDDIFSEVLLRGQTAYGKTLEDLASLDADPRIKLLEFCKGWLSNESNWAFTIMLQSIRTNQTVNPEIRAAATQRFTGNLEPLAEIIRQGQADGTLIAGDSRQLAFYFVSLIQGLTLQLAPGYEIPVHINPSEIVALFLSADTPLPETDPSTSAKLFRFQNKKMFDK
ncbi:TetR/AcrR family transcriptional regulator [Paenibacillus camerounensis]|uniref:TetR/AcrR family transcriptional regulator n=1 Tax=Paenibacillus camerounensis TaxID=1243663 RepID=UPI000A322971|nr:TetR/AcrR family transcriptional regulator [Paenibacillus camerounensis]